MPTLRVLEDASSAEIVLQIGFRRESTWESVRGKRFHTLHSEYVTI